MICNECRAAGKNAVALYRVGRQGFCKAHYGSAVTIRKSVGRAKNESDNTFFDTIIDDRERRMRAATRNAARKRRK
jgi:hypothetical protein